MAEEFQSLLDKINQEGVKKAEARAAEIIAAADEQAKSIRSKAHSDAETIVKQATEQAQGLEKRAEAAVRQASRDIILELQSELERRMKRAVSAATEQALTPDFMAGIIKEFAAKFAAEPESEITVLTAVKDTQALDNALKATLAGSFKTDPKVFPDSGIRGGMEVSFKAGEGYFDFTSEAVTELISAYIGPRLAALLSGE